MDGDVYLHNPHEVAQSITIGVSADELHHRILEGARAGMLRAFVIPRGYTSDSNQSSFDAEFIEYLQITWIEAE